MFIIELKEMIVESDSYSLKTLPILKSKLNCKMIHLLFVIEKRTDWRLSVLFMKETRGYPSLTLFYFFKKDLIGQNPIKGFFNYFLL